MYFCLPHFHKEGAYDSERLSSNAELYGVLSSCLGDLAQEIKLATEKVKAIRYTGLFRDIYTICMKDGGWLLQPICKRIATAYSGAVLIFGNKYYEEGQDEACEWQPCVE